VTFLVKGSYYGQIDALPNATNDLYGKFDLWFAGPVKIISKKTVHNVKAK